MSKSLTTRNHSSPIAMLAWRAVGDQQHVLRAIALVVMGSLLLAASAKVQVPFWPVPMTMQTYVVLLLGITYGWRLGLATVALYLAEGALGLPVFAGTPERGLGIAYMVGPTGGYLLGFLLAAGVTGWMAERGFARTLPQLVALMLIGHAIIFLPGVGWLSAFVGAEDAVTLGVAPFLTATILKVGLGVGTIALLNRQLRG